MRSCRRCSGTTRVKLVFADGTLAEVKPQARGYAGLGAMFWVLCALALVLYLMAMVVLLARPRRATWSYALMALCQAGNLLFIAVESSLGLGLPATCRGGTCRPAWRSTWSPRRPSCMRRPCTRGRCRMRAPIALGAWSMAALLCVLSARRPVCPMRWWWTQAAIAQRSALLAIALLSWSYRIEPHPLADGAAPLRRIASTANAGIC